MALPSTWSEERVWEEEGLVWLEYKTHPRSLRIPSKVEEGGSV